MEFSEDQLIDRIKKLCGSQFEEIVEGIGDDCAVRRGPNGLYDLITTDDLIENIHFKLDYFTPEELGRRLLHVNMSDVAAMGGTPSFALVSLNIPPKIDAQWVERFYEGLSEETKKHHVAIIGGNLTSSIQDLRITMTLNGTVLPQYLKLRRGAQRGDAIYVSAPLGRSALGRLQCQKGLEESEYVFKHKAPQARLAQGAFLGQQTSVTSMMDMSDGLLMDLHRLCRANHLGCHLYEDQIPITQDFKKTCRQMDAEWKKILMTGGEDYELLFTVNAASEAAFRNSHHQEGFEFFKIGTMVSGEEKIQIIDIQGHQRVARVRGFDHFK